MHLRLCLFILPFAASLTIPPSSPSGRGRPTNSDQQSCNRIDQQRALQTARAFHDIQTRSEQWYECAAPADDPSMTCFMAPEWMNLGPEKWLCTDALKSDEKLRTSYGEDSY
ncbi:hypothetical protein AB1Y20_014810 [Prymnesium parvum]|uniref:Uncharacterized protein n=1 Tax=Prymnesium parvum TaxID=97485 RepID=A0AB34IEQ9_PRYPA